MELKYVLLTIIKILISIPLLIILCQNVVNGTTLMGGHLDNNSTNITEMSKDYNINSTDIKQDNEKIPDPSPLVLPGYNLPENIFNKGKPFYLEKDPLTGQIDFNTKTSNDYEYIEEEPNKNIFDKSNIDRKDGPLSSHKPNDVNQLTPNFHDFLNLPIKYNSDKYIYPLISSSYANTKIQGNVNRFHNNHKDYNIKTSTYKPIVSPTYYTSNTYHQTSSIKPITTSTPKVYFTTTKPSSNLMNHPQFHEDFDEYYDMPTTKKSEIYLTTKKLNEIYLTTKSPPISKKPLSLFEQLFGEYDEVVSTTEKPKPPPLFTNLPQYKHKYTNEVKTEKPSYVSSTPVVNNGHGAPNILTNINTDLDEYQYEEFDDIVDEEEEKNRTETNSSFPSTVATKITEKTTLKTTTKLNDPTTTTTTTTFRPKTSTTAKVTSLPLGENHIGGLNNNQPIIVATQNLREQLNNEKVHPIPFGFNKPPSTSSIHIPHDQDTISFVVGHHQKMESDDYIGSTDKEILISNPFNLYYGQVDYDTVTHKIQSMKPQLEVVSAVTIQPQVNSEASLAIGVPIGGINKQIPGQVVDEKLEINQDIQFPKGSGNKIVFPKDEIKSSTPSIQSSPSALPPTKEILKLSIKPVYHQLPSELTPPKEKDILPPTRLDRPRPPWDPRPGHFHSGKPEYVRPPRPDLPFKRIDSLPNILPQFRPNMNKHVHYNRQPLLERPSNRPIGFFEKLQPPPPPPPLKNLHNLRKIPPPPPPPLSPVPSKFKIAEDRIINEPPKKPMPQEHFFQTPPKVVLANRRMGTVEGDVETLQMIQAKQSTTSSESSEIILNTTTDKPLYVVYPVNTPPMKIDVIDTNKKETIVIGTRAESPLPPSKINEYYEKNPIFAPARNDAPILKPRPPLSFPSKTDFPYPLERPDPLSLNPAVPESSNNLDSNEESIQHWGSAEKVTNSNQISATLKTYTEKPIAVAYTPTETHLDYDKFSMPNYGSPVIPEIRLEDDFNNNREIEEKKKKEPIKVDETYNDFQAPFQASVNIDSVSQGWSVVKEKSKSTSNNNEANVEVTTLPLATTSEFDIENFKPQLIGGFKPIYDYAQNIKKEAENISERQE